MPSGKRRNAPDRTNNRSICPTWTAEPTPEYRYRVDCRQSGKRGTYTRRRRQGRNLEHPYLCEDSRARHARYSSQRIWRTAQMDVRWRTAPTHYGRARYRLRPPLIITNEPVSIVDASPRASIPMSCSSSRVRRIYLLAISPQLNHCAANCRRHSDAVSRCHC